MGIVKPAAENDNNNEATHFGNVAPPAYDSLDGVHIGGSTDHLLSSPPAGQMPPQVQPQRQQQQQPMLVNPNTHPAFARPVNDPGWRIPVQNYDDHYERVPITGPPNFREPQNLICTACNHRSPTVVRMKRGAFVSEWPWICCLMAIVPIIFFIFLIYALGEECINSKYMSCVWMILVVLFVGALILLCCCFPCFCRHYWDAYHHCSNCDQLLRKFARRTMSHRP